MSLNFRPKLLVLEAREVPACFSFQLQDGSIGSGLFTTPDGVNPAQASQTFNLSDLSVTKNNVTYSVQPGATATYEYGTLVAVSAVANGPDTITLTTQVDFGGIIFEAARFGGPLLESKRVVIPSGQIVLPE